MPAGCRVARTLDPQRTLGNDENARRNLIKKKAAGYGLVRVSFFILTESACRLVWLNDFLCGG